MSKSIYYREAPKVTVFLFAYNQEHFIEAACQSVLSQDYDTPMQIIFSDDCSQDDTFTIMTAIAESYEGIHTLILNRNSKNLGLINHVNLSYKLSTGDLIFAAAGDDISLPSRVTENVKAYRLSKKLPMSLYSAVYEMSELGEVGKVRKPPYTKVPSVEVCATSPAIVIGAAHAWHRNVFDIFGEITESGAYEDLVIAYRSALLDGLIYIDLPLIQYRLDVGISQTKKYEKDGLSLHKLFIKIGIQHSNVMLPVLRQRLKDSLAKGMKEKYLFHIIKNEISKEELRLKFLSEEEKFIQLILSTNSTYLKLFLIKLWTQILIREQYSFLNNSFNSFKIRL